jgi:hypothetical protein
MRKDQAAALAAIRNKARWDKRDAEVALEALERSGQSLAAFCREQGLSYERVGRWRSALRRVKPPIVDLLHVDVVRGPEPMVNERAAEVQIVLCNGRRLAVSGEVDQELLAEVAQAVAPCVSIVAA